MITAYHRPTTLEEALNLLTQAHTIPLGGGTFINTPQFTRTPVSVVDLQALGLNRLQIQANHLEIGATVTLQQLTESELTPAALQTAARLETTLNIRNAATVAGTLVSCNGRSPFATAMLALDAELTFEAAGQPTTLLSLGDFLPLGAHNLSSGRLITTIRLPLKARLAYEYVARTPSDQPIVCAAVAQWPSGRTRVALGGFGAAPRLAADGPEAAGVEIAARAAYSQAADAWASAEYRAAMAETLTLRCLQTQR